MVKESLRLEDLKGKTLAVDGNNVLYQFLSLIRLRDGTPLMDSMGNITSHLAGLMFRSARLMHDFEIDLVFVFDGVPHSLKMVELQKRREVRDRAFSEWKEAIKRGDYGTAFSKAVVTGRLTSGMVDDAKRLLRLLGIPVVEAPGEAEAQAAFMAMRGDVWASSSRDYDSLLFGTPRLVRYLTISGKEYLPSKGVFRPLKPELICLHVLLSRYGISREQLVDLAILVGTDFNEGVKGIGPKRALRLIQRYGRIENLPSEVRSMVSPHYEEVRKIFLEPKVTSDYILRYKGLQEDELRQFLCEERGFSEERVERVIQRMRAFYARKKEQRKLKRWFS